MTQWGEFPEIGKLLYALGAGTGGIVGGVLPDVLEPALHSYHRDVFHSLFTGGVVVAVGYKSAKTLGAELCAEAARLRLLRLALSREDPERLILGLRECLIYTVLGFSLGLTVGYATHVVADMATPRGVPLVARRII